MNMKPNLVLLLSLFLAGTAAAETTYQPFVLASINDAGLEQQTEETVMALKKAGFTIAGQYSPFDNSNVIVATSPNLKAVAAVSYTHLRAHETF